MPAANHDTDVHTRTMTDTHDHYNQINIKGRNIQSNSSTSDVSKTSSVTSVNFAKEWSKYRT